MLTVNPVRHLAGTVTVPGDKSISHRAVMLGALAEGTTEITNFLPGADCRSTIACLRACGVEIVEHSPEHILVHGRGAGGLAEPADVLDVGNSGTTMRLLSGLLAGQPFLSVLTGDASIRRRPMDRVAVPLRQMGAQVLGRAGGRLAPLVIQGGSLEPIHYLSPVASAQVKSAVLLAGLSCAGETAVTEPAASRDHTERMLRGFGAAVRVEGRTAAVMGRPRLEGQQVPVPGDLSSAAFFAVAAAIRPGSEVCITGVGLNPTRTGLLTVLQAMGADLRVENEREVAGEPVGDLIVRGGASLRGVVVGGEQIPRLVDEVPILAVAACCAEGTTVIRDAAELRVKESDRLAAVTRELSRLGARITEQPDGLIIEGTGGFRRGRVASHDDHRLAMSLAVAALAADGPVEIEGDECIAVSFPGFGPRLDALRAR